MLIGYARVSTDDQDTQLQTDALEKAGCNRVFREKASGAKTDRPELARLIDTVRKDDVVIVWKLDRLGRSLPTSSNSSLVSRIVASACARSRITSTRQQRVGGCSSI